jgi:hypothetical protein
MRHRLAAKASRRQVPRPVQFLKGVNHILKRGGFALVTFPDISAPKSRYYKLMANLIHREWVWVTCHIPLHIWEFTYQSARATFDRSGFSIVGFRRAEVDGEFTGKEAILTWAVKPLRPRFGKSIGTGGAGRQPPPEWDPRWCRAAAGSGRTE